MTSVRLRTLPRLTQVKSVTTNLTWLLAQSNIVEIFNNGENMATVNFSVPEDIKQEFNRVFAGPNKSAIVADLLRQAIENEQQRGNTYRPSMRF